jgi:rare lipoprotein A
MKEIWVVGIFVLMMLSGIILQPGYDQIGIASWYGPGFHGNLTSNGETYDMHEMTAAHKTLPFNTLVRVIDLDTGDSIIVRINDRGPFIRGRIIDLSLAAAQKLGSDQKGIANVGLRIVESPEEIR